MMNARASEILEDVYSNITIVRITHINFESHADTL